MAQRRRYRKKADQFVIAVQLDLDTDGIVYWKWGGKQHAKRGDWLVDNDGDVYTIDRKVFAKTYKRLRPGTYLKITPVWAEVATRSGSVKTREGQSRYKKGDYIVYNYRNGRDGYCMTAAKFKEMYQQDKQRAK
jgi:hypothetical protein